jgi:hypothetical protein
MPTSSPGARRTIAATEGDRARLRGSRLGRRRGSASGDDARARRPRGHGARSRHSCARHRADARTRDGRGRPAAVSVSPSGAASEVCPWKLLGNRSPHESPHSRLHPSHQSLYLGINRNPHDARQVARGHGKEGVDGSSPSEGSEEARHSSRSGSDPRGLSAAGRRRVITRNGSPRTDLFSIGAIRTSRRISRLRSSSYRRGVTASPVQVNPWGTTSAEQVYPAGHGRHAKTVRWSTVARQRSFWQRGGSQAIDVRTRAKDGRLS